MVGGTSRLWIKQVRLFDLCFFSFVLLETSWLLQREREPAIIKVAYESIIIPP